MVNIPPIKIVIWGIVFLIGLPTLHHLQTRESCCHYGDEWRTYHRHRRTIRSFPWPEVNRSSQVHPLCGKDFSSWRDLLRHGMGSGEVLCGRGPSPVGRSYWLWKVDVREWSNRRRSLQELRRGFKLCPMAQHFRLVNWSSLVPIGPHWSPLVPICQRLGHRDV